MDKEVYDALEALGRQLWFITGILNKIVCEEPITEKEKYPLDRVLCSLEYWFGTDDFRPLGENYD